MKLAEEAETDAGRIVELKERNEGKGRAVGDGDVDMDEGNDASLEKSPHPRLAVLLPRYHS